MGRKKIQHFELETKIEINSQKLHIQVSILEVLADFTSWLSTILPQNVFKYFIEYIFYKNILEYFLKGNDDI